MNRKHEFVATVATFSGGFELEGPVADVFPLFSPEGERAWVPGWNPEILHPRGAVWQEEMLFRTPEEKGDAVWVVTRLDRDLWNVVYHRVEADRYVARVEVTCIPRDERRTEVWTSYTFVGLSNGGNSEITEMTEEAYAAKMLRWKGWIDAHLTRSGNPGKGSNA